MYGICYFRDLRFWEKVQVPFVEFPHNNWILQNPIFGLGWPGPVPGAGWTRTLSAEQLDTSEGSGDFLNMNLALRLAHSHMLSEVCCTNLFDKFNLD